MGTELTGHAGIPCTNSVVENSKPKQVNKIPHVLGAGVMAQQLRTLAAVPDDPGFRPQTFHDGAQPSTTPVLGDLSPSSGLHWYCMHMANTSRQILIQMKK